MPLGSITYHIDFPDIAIWLFFGAFSALVIVLRTLDKREGYPMRASPFDARTMQGFPPPPAPVTYRLHEGGVTVAPHLLPQAPISAEPLYPFDGTPLSPVGNPLLAGIGPGAWVMRRDEPMLTEKGEPMLAPLRHSPEWSVETGEADPRGMAVLDRRYRTVGVVHDVWVDKSIKILRLFEVELHDGLADGRRLVPIFHTDIREKAREVRVTALEWHQFADIPVPAEPHEITAREDDRLNAYFAAGYFYRDTAATFPPHKPDAATTPQGDRP